MVKSASASSKAILLGEHAVVYGQPAIAVPVSDVRAVVEIEERPAGSGILIFAHDLGLRAVMAGVPAADTDPALLPLETTIRNTFRHLGVPATHLDMQVHIRSQIPVARGMGSGTAVATALVRALADHVGQILAPDQVSALVYQTEILLHGTPSGIDNTVVAYEKAVYFCRGQEPETLSVGKPFGLVIGDTGVASETRVAVGNVRRGRERDPSRYETFFDQIGDLVRQARQALIAGEHEQLGMLMNTNQEILERLGVSSPELERLILAARSAGALGAKLSGAGLGGCMVAIGRPSQREAIAEMLSAAGAALVLSTDVA